MKNSFNVVKATIGLKKTHEKNSQLTCLHGILPFIASLFTCFATNSPIFGLSFAAIFEAWDFVLSQATPLRLTKPVYTCRRHIILATSSNHNEIYSVNFGPYFKCSKILRRKTTLFETYRFLHLVAQSGLNNQGMIYSKVAWNIMFNAVLQ